MGWGVLSEIFEAVIAVSLLGITVAVLYRLIVGEIPWSFFIGEVVGFGMGAGLLVCMSPRRRGH